MADPQVRRTQQWLNTTYASRAGWVPLEEDGLTGWGTIYGLRRALQAELGISRLASGFGPATTSAYKNKIGTINASFKGPQNILCILSGALWCKGYTAVTLNSGASFGFDALAGSVASVCEALGLGTGAPGVDVKVMASLLSMDAYEVLGAYGGTSAIREVQRWLNGTYRNREDFALVPCDGVHSRSVQTALLLALQYELGMADGVANGNFGQGTKSGLRAKANISVGSTDISNRFVRIFHAAMILNGLDIPLSMGFTSTTSSVIREFQSFMEIPQTGAGDYTTWCTLLVSCGDTTIATTGFDTSHQLLGGKAAAAVQRGYTHVGRYLVGENGKYLCAPEIAELRAAGLRLAPIYQRFNDKVAYLTRDNGMTEGLEALVRGRVLGLPAGSIIYFSVDFDATGDVVSGAVAEYFGGVKEIMDAVAFYNFRIGVYATRNVCQVMIDRGLAVAAYVSGMSTGYSGNMGFPMPREWHYNQIIELTDDLGSTTIDHVVVSRRAQSVDLAAVSGPPVEQDGSYSETGFNALFQWYVEAEVRCEKLLKASYGSNSIYIPMSWQFILGWMRKPTYWGTNSYGLWLVYTPEADDAITHDARAACEGALSLNMTMPDTVTDAAHWAVATLAYAMWDVNIEPSDYTYGDLGGWALDLYSLFGEWQTKASGDDLFTWVLSHLGTNEKSSFGKADLLADVDAWLAIKVDPNQPGLPFREHLRSIFSMSPDERLTAFFEDRFQSSAANVESAFSGIADGVGSGIFKEISLQLMKQVAGFTYPPTEAERQALVSAFVERLTRGVM